MRNRLLSALLAAGLLLALCACAPEKSAAVPSATPSVSATPTPVVTPEMTPTPSPTATPPQGNFPEGLPELAQTPIDEDIAALLLNQSEGATFKGSEILSLELQHSFVNYETYADLWWLSYRVIPEDMGTVVMYNRTTDGKGGILGNCFIVVQVSPDRAYCEQYYGSIPNDGSSDLSDEAACQKKVFEVVTGIYDLEFSLSRWGFPGRAGLGGNGTGLFTATYENNGRTEEKLDWKVYIDGDYYQRYTWNALSILSLVSPSRNREYIVSIDTTLPDVKTYRGIGPGATRDEVLAAYPEIDPDRTGEEKEVHLVYESIPGYIAGQFLHFYFDDGKVNRIMLENISD